ncbi:MAG: hypothetical protein ACFNZW_07505 [Coriobacteriaceae bacterium]
MDGKALPRIERAEACGREAAALQGVLDLMDDPHRCSLVREAHAGEHWSP